MAKPNVLGNQVLSNALEILGNAPTDGLRFSELLDEVSKRLPGSNRDTLATMIAFRVGKDERVERPERGLYRLVGPKVTETKSTVSLKKGKSAIFEAPHAHEPEVRFYEPFKLWLETDVQECTRAMVVGGNRFGSKWGTPDVIGVWKPEPDDIIKPPEEIVSAEIKTDTNGLITAFGQACAYKLFSHKTYIAIPRKSSKADVERLESLCQITGIGLVLFDAENPARPGFEIRTRPMRHDPDVFYMNEAAKNFKELF